MVSEDEYELLEQIGRGSFGKVYRARHVNGEVHAIKIVELEAAEDGLESIQQEVQMLQAFNCPQLTRYYGSIVVGSSLWIVMELLEGGSLQDLIKSSDNNLDEPTAQWILKEMLKALSYLHAERKIHRDVKAGNILVAANGSVRLADFGESVQLTHSIAKRQTFAGSPYWMAPEVIMAQDTYNSKADIWSLGITAIEMIEGTPPLSHLHPMKAVLFIPTNPPPTLPKNGPYSRHFHNFLEQCLERDPQVRPSAQDLLKHPFMRGAKQTELLSKLLEGRRAAALMKSLFGTGGTGDLLGGSSLSMERREPSGAESGLLSTPPQRQQKPKPSNLPAAAAAAIAAVAASSSSSAAQNAFSMEEPDTATYVRSNSDGIIHPPRINDKNNTDNNDYSSSDAALIEWDFGDAGDSPPPQPAHSPTKAAAAAAAAAPTASTSTIKGAAGIERLEALNGGAAASTTTDVSSVPDSGRSKGAAAAAADEDTGDATQSAKSEDVVTPKARGGSSGCSGMWGDPGRSVGATGSGGMAAPGSGGRDQTGSRRRKVRSSVEERWRQRSGSESFPARPAAAGDVTYEMRETEQNKNTKPIKLKKVASILGVDDIESAISVQGDMVELARKARAEEIRRQQQGLCETPAVAAANAPAAARIEKAHLKLETQSPTSGFNGGASAMMSPLASAGGGGRGVRPRSTRSGSMLGRFLRSAARDSLSSSPSSPGIGVLGWAGGKRYSHAWHRSRSDNSNSSCSPEPLAIGATAGGAAAAAAVSEKGWESLMGRDGRGSGGEEETSSPVRNIGRRTLSDSAASSSNKNDNESNNSNTLPPPASTAPGLFSLDAFVKSIGVEDPLSAASSRGGSVKGAGDELVGLVARTVAGEHEDSKGVVVRGVGDAGANCWILPSGDSKRDGDENGVGRVRGRRDREKGEDAGDANKWDLPMGEGREEEPEEPSPVVSTSSNMAVFHSTDGGGGGSAGRRSRSIDFDRLAFERDEDEPWSEGDGGQGKQQVFVASMELASAAGAGGREPREGELNLAEILPPARAEEACTDDEGEVGGVDCGDDGIVAGGVATDVATGSRTEYLDDDDDNDVAGGGTAADVAGGERSDYFDDDGGDTATDIAGGSRSEYLDDDEVEAGAAATDVAGELRSEYEDDDDEHDGAGGGREAEMRAADDPVACLGKQLLLSRDSSADCTGSAAGDDGGMVNVGGDGAAVHGASAPVDSAGGREAGVSVVVRGEESRDEVQEEGQGDTLTAAFHRHLTPALCELWAATEEGSAQRQAVQELAMAMERLDGCSEGGLTSSFVEAVAKSWPGATGEDLNTTSRSPATQPE